MQFMWKDFQSSSKWVYIGHGFDTNGPYLDIDEFGKDKKRLRFSLTGKSFTLKRMDERFCAGSFNLETLKGERCADQRPLFQTTNTSCKVCFDLTGFNPAFYHMQSADISARQRAYNQTPHVVYLAFFAPGIIKVGISSVARMKDRWLEQGARVALHLLTVSNAYEAREWEAKISEKLDLPEVILGRKKRAVLNFDVSTGEEELARLKTRISQELNPEVRSDTPKNLEDDYNPGRTSLVTTLVDVTDDEDTVSGRFVALYGDILVVENGGQQFICSLKKWTAHVIEVSSEVNPMRFAPQQTSLF